MAFNKLKLKRIETESRQDWIIDIPDIVSLRHYDVSMLGMSMLFQWRPLLILVLSLMILCLLNHILMMFASLSFIILGIFQELESIWPAKPLKWLLMLLSPLNCNSLLYRLPKFLFAKLQSVQNSAACLVCMTRKFDRITTPLIDLHWPTIRHHIFFKILLLVYN